MINDSKAVDDSVLKVLDGMELHGKINVDEDFLLSNISYAVRQGATQVRPDPPKPDRVILIGGGPSLADPAIFETIRTMLWEGNTFLVTMNGAYHWAIERNLRPNTQIVMDAQPHNARFVDPPVPNCRYLLASQCHPKVWDAVKGRSNVWIFHAAAGGDDRVTDYLNKFYGEKHWYGVSGGTTVATRSISVLRTLGYIRFELFGVDSCWMGNVHHAYSQPENDKDRRMKVDIHPAGHPEMVRTFQCSPWHMKQVEDFIQVIRVNGQHFLLSVHGDGMIAYLLQSGADATIKEQEQEAGSATPAQGSSEGLSGDGDIQPVVTMEE